MLSLLSSCPALHMSPPVSGARRSLSPRMGLFDGAKEAFGAGEKPLVGGDRITPFDRWLGLDKELESETIERVGTSGVSFIDPNDASSYFTVSLAKPMGIAFVENVGDCNGLVVDEVLPTGSAAASEKAIASGDQLVAVDTTLVLGNDFDTGLEVRHPIRRRHAIPTALSTALSTAESDGDIEGRSAGALGVAGGDSCARLHTAAPPHRATPRHARAGDQGFGRDDQARLLPRTDHVPVRPHQAGRGVVQEQPLVGAARSMHRSDFSAPAVCVSLYVTSACGVGHVLLLRSSLISTAHFQKYLRARLHTNSVLPKVLPGSAGFCRVARVKAQKASCRARLPREPRAVCSVLVVFRVQVGDSVKQ